jgi:hypothetical protein
VAYLGGFGSAQTSATGATLAITASSTIPAGTVLVLAAVWDNIDTTTPTISSISTAGGGSWTSRASTSAGVTASAGAGIFTDVWTTTTTSQITSGTTISTITWSSASTDTKSVIIVGFSEQLETIRGSVVTGTPSTGGTPTVTTSTAPVTNDVVIGVVAGEDNGAPTGDADTLNGSWSTIASTNTTGGSAASNTTIGIQVKTVTAGGNQTYNPTTANDSVAIIFTLATPIAATFNNGSNTSLTSGNFAPTIAYKPEMTGQSNSNGELPSLAAVNTFVLTAQSNSAGSLAAGLRRPISMSGQSNSNLGSASIGLVMRTTGWGGSSATTGSLAAFRAVGATMSGQSNSSGSGVITATRRPTMIGQSNSAGTLAPIVAFMPTATGQSNASGSFKVGIDSPGSSLATAFSYGSLAAGRKFDTTLDLALSNSDGSVDSQYSLSTLFIGWGNPI